VERAKTIWLLHNGEKVASISQKFDRTQVTIYQQLRRFNELGLESLVDKARSGRPTTYTEEERGQMIVAVRTHL
jgi:transposase